MKVEGTDLDYNDADEIALDRYLSSSTENKHAWAKRVWNNCRIQSEGQFIARVYECRPNQTWQDRARELWDNKKIRRKSALKLEFALKDTSDNEIIQLKNHAQYKTRDQLEAIDNGKL